MAPDRGRRLAHRRASARGVLALYRGAVAGRGSAGRARLPSPFAVANPAGLALSAADRRRRRNREVRRGVRKRAGRSPAAGVGASGTHGNQRGAPGPAGKAELAGRARTGLGAEHLRFACIRNFTASIFWRTATTTRTTASGRCCWKTRTAARRRINDPELQSWLTPDLQLIVFHACLSAGTTAEGRAPFTGLAPRLIRLGLPASVAMQDFVEMEDARVFFSEFYRALLDDGLVDVAVNRGRQRLVGDPRVDNWSIPALFSRLRGGKLWPADPIRQAIATDGRRTAAGLADMAPAPGDRAYARRRRLYSPVEGASGPRLDLWKRASELAATPGSFTILTGSRGSLIAAQLRRLFRTTATQMLNGASAGPWPVFVTLAELAGRGATSWPILQRIWTGDGAPRRRGAARRTAIPVSDRRGGRARPASAASMRSPRSTGSERWRAAPSSCSPTSSWSRRSRGTSTSATLLVAQQLDPPQVSSYLEELGTPVGEKRSRRHSRRRVLRPGQPAALPPAHAGSRGARRTAQVAAQHPRTRGRHLSGPHGHAPGAGRLHAGRARAHRVGDPDGTQPRAAPAVLLPLLAEARGGREFHLTDLKHGLVDESRLLVPNGDEGVRFTYPVMQAYFAARYLADAPDRTRLVEDITASLGRLARLRRWQKVLVLAATMVPVARPRFCMRCWRARA